MPVKSILLLSVMATLGSFVAAFGCGDGLTAYCGHKQGAACVLELFSDQIGGSCSPDVEQQRSVIVSAAPSLTPARPLPHHKYGGSIALYHFRVPWELGHNSPDVLGANLKGL
ncbi:hypothetical protein MJO28_015631 [Puccinia striiformis f. sp. tritici]|uniref:Uncharacterized protein n=1 Tax=Puccinia striiformis f. sp. tritici TaxID=168172 RepID=A0ACC0DQD8_9BASI|nr:hypothetical protein MJO28_015631 [Puccinia striiformis f. sp. tritici]